MKSLKLISIMIMIVLFYSGIGYAQKTTSKTDDQLIPKPDKIIIDPVKPDNVITGNDTGQVDWTDQVIIAKGWTAIDTIRFTNIAQAELMARRGATVVAQRNLLETIKGVRIVGETTVRNLVTENDYIYSRLDGIIKGAVMVGEPIINEGVVEVTMQVPIYEPVKGSNDTASVASLLQKKFSTSNVIKTAPANRTQASNVNPSMLPVVKDENGNIKIDYTKGFDPKAKIKPKWFNFSKKVAEELNFKEGVDIIEGIQNSDGTISVNPGQLDKMEKWGKIGKISIKVGAFLFALI